MKIIEDWNAYDVISSGGIVGYGAEGVYRYGSQGELILYAWPVGRDFYSGLKAVCHSLMHYIKTERLRPFLLTDDIIQTIGESYENEISQAADSIFGDALNHTYLRFLHMDSGESYSGGRSLFLNRNWIESHCRWSCPVCEREKKDLIFQDSKGAWRGELVRHHDHVTDIYGWFLKDFGIAFEDVLICSKCNTLEGVPKANGLVEKWFSFDWWQIKEALINKQDGTFDIDIDKAMSIYHEVAPKKKSFVDRALILREGFSEYRELTKIYHRPLGNKYNSAPDLETSARVLSEKIFYDLNAPGGPNTLLGMPSRRSFKVPSQIDIEKAVQTYLSVKDKKVDVDQWRCDCCKRTAYECVRLYPKKMKFKLEVSYIDLDEWRASLCMDCTVSINAIAKRNNELSRSLLFDACCEHVEARENQPTFFDEEAIIISLSEKSNPEGKFEPEFVFDFEVTK